MKDGKTLDYLVIGAGQAGLAAGYFLQRAGHRFLIIDANPRIGDSWRQRWEGLRLFSPNQYNALPGLRPAGDPLRLPDRLEVADYLKRYAAHFDLPVLTARRCASVTRTALSASGKSDDCWEIVTSNGVFYTRKLIVASGAYRTPFVPEDASRSFPDYVAQYHSSEVRRVTDLAEANTSVLVVGAGASGQQLSRLLRQSGAEVTLAGPEVANLPRRLLGKDIYWWLYTTGIMTLRNDRPPGSWLLGDAQGDVTVGEPPIPEDIHRIKTEVTHWENGGLHFNCQKTMPTPLPWPERDKAVVIWCTGYRNAYPFLPDEATDAKGSPRHKAGVSTTLPGLYFLGLPNLLRPNSSLLGGVGRDAERLFG